MKDIKKYLEEGTDEGLKQILNEKVGVVLGVGNAIDALAEEIHRLRRVVKQQNNWISSLERKLDELEPQWLLGRGDTGEK